MCKTHVVINNTFYYLNRLITIRAVDKWKKDLSKILKSRNTQHNYLKSQVIHIGFSIIY